MMHMGYSSAMRWVVVNPGEQVSADEVIALALEYGATVNNPLDPDAGVSYNVYLHPEVGVKTYTDEELREAMDKPY